MKFKRVLLCILACLMIVTCFHTETAQAAEKNYTNRDLKYMSCIIWCEAGNQSYAGKLAVGCVVMNRVRSHSFPNSVRGVIYQRSQFTPTRNGAMHKALVAYKQGRFERGERAQCVKAAKAALEGQSYVVSRGRKINMKRMHFFSRSLSHAKVRINAHAFK